MVLRRKYFSDPDDVHMYEQKIFFYHHISSFLRIVWFLSQCIHSETSFVVYFLFYNGDTRGTLAFHKSWLGSNLFTFLSVLLYV